MTATGRAGKVPEKRLSPPLPCQGVSPAPTVGIPRRCQSAQTRVAAVSSASLVTALAATLLAVLPAAQARAAPMPPSQGKPVTASSQEHYGTPATACRRR